MKLAQAELHDALKIAMLGASNNEAVEILTHVFFTGKQVYGYDGSLYVSRLLESDFKGSVRAATLWTLVDGLAGTGDAELLVEDKELKLKMGRSTLRMPFNAATEFEQPKARKQEVAITIDHAGVDAFCEAMRKCLVVSDSIGHHDFSRGVVFKVAGNGKLGRMYATDSSKLIRCAFQMDVRSDLNSVIIPIRCAQAILAIHGTVSGAPPNSSEQIVLDGKQLSYKVFADDMTVTVAQVICPIPKPEEELPIFDQVIEQHCPSAAQKKQGIDITETKLGLMVALKRSKKLMSAELSRWVKIVGSNGKLLISTQTGRGEKLRESVNITWIEGFECYADVDGLLQAIDVGDFLYLTKKSGAAFNREGYIYIFPVTDKPT
jgi:hypothetical protein